MPKLIRLYIVSVAIGFALAALFVAMLVWFDIANLRSTSLHYSRLRLDFSEQDGFLQQPNGKQRLKSESGNLTP